MTRSRSVPVRDGSAGLLQVVQVLNDAGIAVSGLSLLRPSLDDVFLPLTSPSAWSSTPPANSPLGIDGHGAVWKVLLWSAALLTVFIPVAMLQYRRRGA